MTSSSEGQVGAAVGTAVVAPSGINVVVVVSSVGAGVVGAGVVGAGVVGAGDVVVVGLPVVVVVVVVVVSSWSVGVEVGSTVGARD